MSFYHYIYRGVPAILTLICLVLQGCSLIKPYRPVVGDTVLADYTCFLENGEVAATTLKQIAQDPGQQKSVVFVRKASYGPIEITAGADDACEGCQKNKELERFETVIEHRLSQAVVGLGCGKTHRIELTALERKDVKKSERIIALARFRKAPKVLRMDRDQYVLQMKKKPEADQSVGLYDGLAGKVISVKASEVVIRFTPATEAFVEGPFGKVRVTDRGDYFELETIAQKGRLVRTGPIVGRITDVGDTSFTLDYGHPFGGQTLICDVRLKKEKNI